MVRHGDTPEGNYKLATQFVSDELKRERSQFLKSVDEEKKAELSDSVK